jgi:hypothetical protein
MKTLITVLALVFTLATITSMIALTVYGDHPHIDQDSPYKALHQKTALLY